jgi:hypothetical protein
MQVSCAVFGTKVSVRAENYHKYRSWMERFMNIIFRPLVHDLPPSVPKDILLFNPGQVLHGLRHKFLG